MRSDLYLRQKAWQYIIENRIQTLPVDVFGLASKYVMLSYRHYSELTGKTMAYIIDRYDRDGFVFWSNRQQNYIVCFNDAQPAVTVRWTVMHEIAHITLGHVAPDASAHTRIRKKSHPYAEAEADGFARRVLCPSIVLHNCGALETPDIMALCGISRTAAAYRSRYMKKLELRNMWRTDPLEAKVEAQFNAFVKKYKSRANHMQRLNA